METFLFLFVWINADGHSINHYPTPIPIELCLKVKSEFEHRVLISACLPVKVPELQDQQQQFRY